MTTELAMVFFCDGIDGCQWFFTDRCLSSEWVTERVDEWADMITSHSLSLRLEKVRNVSFVYQMKLFQ